MIDFECGGSRLCGKQRNVYKPLYMYSTGDQCALPDERQTAEAS